MSPQETQALQDFLNQLTQVRGIAKDPQADALIASAVAQQPDAAYLLVQRALLMEQALNTSKAQIASLQSQLQALQAAAPARGFLDGNSWGSAPAPGIRPSPAPTAAAAYAPPQPAYTGAPMPQQAPQYQAQPAPAPSSGFFGGGIGSTLGAVAATAAGVAGGAFLFQGIEHLMNPGSGSSLMHSGGGNMPTETIENTTINNYYSSDSDRSRDDSRSNDYASNDTSSNDILDDSSADYSDSSDSGSFDDSFI